MREPFLSVPKKERSISLPVPLDRALNKAMRERGKRRAEIVTEALCAYLGFAAEWCRAGGRPRARGRRIKS